VRPFLARIITRERIGPATDNYALLGGRSGLLELTKRPHMAVHRIRGIIAAVVNAALSWEQAAVLAAGLSAGGLVVARADDSRLQRTSPFLREAGITACPRCAAIHSGEDRFCPSCGLPLSRNVDLPIGAAPTVAQAGEPATAAMAVPAPGTTAPTPGSPAPATPASAQAPPAGAPVPASAPTAGGAPAPTPAPTAAPALSAAESGAAPSTPGEPATQTHAPVGPAGNGGRSPAPPSQTGATTGEDDQPTEIIRPPATGS